MARRGLMLYSGGKQVSIPAVMPMQIALNGVAKRISWSSLAKDLVEVACMVFIADRLIPRLARGTGRRRLHLHLPVRKPSKWKAVSPYLQDAIAVLSGDAFSFSFAKGRDEDLGFPRLNSAGFSTSVDRIALFSGGLDSGAAAAAFAQKQISTVYVTQYVTGIRRIEKLLDDIQAANGSEGPSLHAQFYIRPKGGIADRLEERSRRCRSFLFASLALATASAVDAGEICICENGPLALNLPLTPAMIPTRHAHSEFLSAMERIGHNLFERPMRVFNPFELATKGEMCEVFVREPQLALRTISCWNQQWSGSGARYGKGHCGHCLPCLIRRTALDAVGIEIPKGHFDLDVRRLARKARLRHEESRKLGPYRALRRFAGEVQSCRNWRAFVRTFPESIGTAPTSMQMSSEDWLRNLFKLMKRFSLEVEHSLQDGRHVE